MSERYCWEIAHKGDRKGPQIGINLTESSSTSVGAREVGSGGEGLSHTRMQNRILQSIDFIRILHYNIMYIDREEGF